MLYEMDKVAQNEKRKKKNYMGFRILKIWQILNLAGTFHQA